MTGVERVNAGFEFLRLSENGPTLFDSPKTGLDQINVNSHFSFGLALDARSFLAPICQTQEQTKKSERHHQRLDNVGFIGIWAGVLLKQATSV
jgi:hypothetical protein